MRALTWNIAAIRGASDTRLAEIARHLASERPDVVMLQEVGDGVVEALQRALVAVGFTAFAAPSERLPGKPYASVIAARWPLAPVDPRWAVGAPWPQLLARATMTVGDRSIEVVSAHMPNGSGNGWRKIDTFVALAKALGAAPKAPRILGGDFNEPQDLLRNGQIVSFGAKKKPDGTYSWEGNRRMPKATTRSSKPESRPREEWEQAVRSVLGPAAPHGLAHVYRWADSDAPIPVTHEKARGPRFFDHLLVSSDFTVEQSGFLHAWRTPGLSDHSAAWAELRLG